MPKLLHVRSGTLLHGTETSALCDNFVARWLERRPGFELDVLDLGANQLPHFGPELIAALSTPVEKRSPLMAELVALSDRLIKQLQQASVVVIDAPMVNRSLSTPLKAWFDLVTIAGRTFRFSAPGVSRGLLFGKVGYCVVSGSGNRNADPARSNDFHTPLLRTLLGFLGIYDVTMMSADASDPAPGKPEDQSPQALAARLAA